MDPLCQPRHPRADRHRDPAYALGAAWHPAAALRHRDRPALRPAKAAFRFTCLSCERILGVWRVLPYIPGLKPADPGPLSRFLPALEQGTVSTWLTQHIAAGSWLLDPFGFSPRLILEAAQAGYRVLVTVNNPVTRFLIEMAANPPTVSDFNAALADLAVSKKGDERLETHLQSLYLTKCANCGREIQAQAFLWRKGEQAPFARIYTCKECGDAGERAVTPEDTERALEDRRHRLHCTVRGLSNVWRRWTMKTASMPRKPSNITCLARYTC